MIHFCTAPNTEHFKKGNHIRLRCRNQHDVYYLKKGIIKIINLCATGKEIIKYIVNEGEIFGLLGLTEGENINDYAVAIEDVIVCPIDAATLKKMMNDNPNLNNYIFTLAGERIKKLEQNLESLVNKNAQTRIKDFILDYIKNFGTVSDDYVIAKNLLSNRDIGKLTSTSRQTVNKTLNTLKLNKIIDFDEKIMRASVKTLEKNTLENVS